MTFAKITDHPEQAQGLFIAQYQEKPRLAAWLYSYTKQIQELEDVFWAVIIERMLDDAVGEQLDALGRLVVEPRQGREDELYRIFLRAKIRTNWSQGNPDDVVAVLRILDAGTFRYLEYYPASFDCEYVVPPTVDGTILALVMRRPRAAGTQGAIVAAELADALCLIGSYDEDEISSTQGGVYDFDDADGGIGANVYE